MSGGRVRPNLGDVIPVAAECHMRDCHCRILMFLLAATPAFADPPAATPVQRIIIIYQENRSFDHYYGTFPGANGILQPNGQLKPELVGLQKNSFGVAYNTTTTQMPGYGAVPSGLPNQPYPLATYYPPNVQTADPTHDFTPMRREAGWTTPPGPQMGPFGMDHWVDAGNRGSMTLGYFTQTDIPRYWVLAQQWTLADNYFQAPWGPSQLNYQFLIAGRPMQLADGTFPQVNTTSSAAPYSQTHRNIGDLLNAAGVSWAWYVGPGDECISNYDGGPFGYFAVANNAAYKAAHFRKYSRFQSDLAGGTLPSVCFIQTFPYSEHAGSGSGHCGFSTDYFPVDVCQTFVGDLVDSLIASSAWPTSAIFITYDECGGWWDHVSPSQYTDTISGNAYDGTTHGDGKFYPVLGNGPRVPLLVISPFAKRANIAHGMYDSCSLTRFIEDNWNLGRLNQGTGDLLRDSQVAPLNASCDFFNFPGLLDGSPALTVNDIPVFVDVLLGIDVNATHRCYADMTNDGIADGRDIAPFVAALSS